MRTDQNTSTTGTLTVLNNSGVIVGVAQDFKITVSSNNVSLTNNDNNGNIALSVTKSGVVTPIVTINGSTGNTAIAGNVNVSGYATATTVTPGTNDTTLATTAFVQGEKVSPTFTGVPIAPTATSGTNTTQIATTAFVTTAVTDATSSLGTMSTQNANAVSITGGSISGVTAPTASAGTNTTQIATTAFVQGEKVSPTFTGVPIAPTATSGTNTTQIATTAFVQTAVINATGALGTMSTQNANAVSITGGSINSLSVTSLGTNGYGTKTVSTSGPSGGSDGDTWYKI
jgi:hypothetical protein